MTKSKSETPLILSIVALSAVILLGLVWLIYLKEKPTTLSAQWGFIPALNALFNLISTTALTCGFIAIKNKKKEDHQKWMIGALCSSALFLVGYIAYHSVHPDAIFLGQGFIRPVYFFTLISHILLTIVGLPFILLTFAFGFLKKFESHKKIARYTWPVWMYISITGVLIYLLRIVTS